MKDFTQRENPLTRGTLAMLRILPLVLFGGVKTTKRDGFTRPLEADVASVFPALFASTLPMLFGIAPHPRY